MYLVMSDSLQPRGLLPARLPCPWGFTRQYTGVGGQSLLQGIFPTQELNTSLLHCKQILYCLSYREDLWEIKRGLILHLC